MQGKSDTEQLREANDFFNRQEVSSTIRSCGSKRLLGHTARDAGQARGRLRRLRDCQSICHCASLGMADEIASDLASAPKSAANAFA